MTLKQRLSEYSTSLIIRMIPLRVRREIVQRFIRARARQGQYLCEEIRYGTNGNLKRWRRVRR